MSYRFYPLPVDGDDEVDRFVLPFECDDLSVLSANDDVSLLGSLNLDSKLSDYDLMNDEEPAASPQLDSATRTLPQLPNAWKARRGSCGGHSIGSTVASVAASISTVNTSNTSATTNTVSGSTISLAAVDDTDKLFALHMDLAPSQHSGVDAYDGSSLREGRLDDMRIDDTLTARPFDVGKATDVTDHDVLLCCNPSDDGLSASLLDDDDATHPHHTGTRLFRDSFYKFHCQYARAKNASEKSSCCHALIQSVLERQGRFLIRNQQPNQGQQMSNDSGACWYEMGVADVLAKADKDFTKLCFVHDWSAERDFFMGRGGHTKDYPAHKLLLDLRDELKETYSNVEGKSNSQRASEAKTRIAQELIDRFYAHELKGRILKELIPGSNQWHIADNRTVLQTFKQKLSEKRKAKANGSTTSCSGSLTGSCARGGSVLSGLSVLTSSTTREVPSFITTTAHQQPAVSKAKNAPREQVRPGLRVPDVIFYHFAGHADADASLGCRSCRDHPGTLQHMSDLRLQHAKYIRAKNDAERVILRQDLVRSVRDRQGRFWIHQAGEETLRLMDTMEIETRLLSDLTQLCFATDACAMDRGASTKQVLGEAETAQSDAPRRMIAAHASTERSCSDAATRPQGDTPKTNSNAHDSARKATKRNRSGRGPLSFQPNDDEAAAVAAAVAAQRVHQHHHQYPPLDPHSHHAAAAQLYSSNLSRPPLPPLAPYPGENVSNYASLGYPHEANAAAAAGLAYHLSDSAQIPSRYDDETMIQSLTDRIATSGSVLTVSGLSYSYHRSQMEDAGLGDFSMVTTEHNERGSGIHADELVVYSNLLKLKVPSIATIESSKATVDTSVPPPPPTPEVDVNQDTGVKVVKITNGVPSEADAHAEIDARFVSTTAADNVVYLYDQNALGSEVYYQKFKAQHEIFIRTGSKSGREKIHEGLVDGIKSLGGIFLKSSPGGVAQVLEMNDSEVAGKVWDFLQQKCFVDFNQDQDVRKGRGGHGKRYPANQRYLDKKDALRTLYVGADYETKNKLAHELVDSVGNEGGRFVDKLDDGRFYVFEHKKALEKAKQALRENRKG